MANENNKKIPCENNNKIPCGGFYLGDGLTMDGNTLKSLGGEQVQTDYAQNDTTAKDYIKNRPFYKESKLVDIYNGEIYPLTITTIESNGAYVAQNSFLYVYEGHKHVVIFDDQTYECDPFDMGDGSMAIGASLDSTGTVFDFTTYPFIITGHLIATKEPGEHTVSEYFYKDVCESGYLPQLNIYCKKNDDNTPYIAAEDIAKIKSAYENGITIKLHSRMSPLSILEEVSEVSDSYIYASHIEPGAKGTIMTISDSYSTTDGSLYRRSKCYAGNITENGVTCPVIYCEGKYYKIAIESNGTLSATEIPE